MTAEWTRWRCKEANGEGLGQAPGSGKGGGGEASEKEGEKAGTPPRGFLPPDDPVYSAGLMVAGIPVEKRRDKEGISLEPKSYSDFLTKALKSILAVSPGISKYVYDHGMSLHPDVKRRLCSGRKSDLPERITVRCYKSENEVGARFHVFPKVRAARGLIRAVRIDDPKGQAGGKGRATEKRVSRKSGARSRPRAGLLGGG